MWLAAGMEAQVTIPYAVPGIFDDPEVAGVVQFPWETVHAGGWNRAGSGEVATRAGLLGAKERLREARADATAKRKEFSGNPKAQAVIWKIVTECVQEEQYLEALLKENYIPQHGPTQLISPRPFFMSPLFRVCSRTCPREKHIELVILTSSSDLALSYTGPELRQSDGLVFMVLLNIARDTKTGVPVTFHPDEVCRLLFGRYDGPTRRRLREHIVRLQGAIIKFKNSSVQLCQRFNFPSSGQWDVALDPDIVNLFGLVPHVWLNTEQRIELPEGLATWLYGLVQCQTTLIPTAINMLRKLCGSDASQKAFTDSLRAAVSVLADHGVLDTGWFIKKGMLHWRKGPTGR
jgi:hypothetical protein